MIQGSTNCPKQFNCAFFLKTGNGYELHFCTKSQQKGSAVHSWYRWFLGSDFFKTLRNYGRLPLELDVDKLMTNMKERDEFEHRLKENIESHEK